MAIKKNQQKPRLEITVNEAAGNFIARSSVFDRRFSKALIVGIVNNRIPIFRNMHPDGAVDWEVDPSLFDPFIEIAGDYYDVVIPGNNKKRKPLAQTTSGESDPYGLFLRLAPDNVLTQIYKLMAFALHPDRGGNTGKMQTLNDAWEKIKKERGL